MEPGETITVKGKTKKGEERIRDHGNLWLVVLFSETVWKAKPAFLLQSHKDNYRRWLERDIDPDFEVVAEAENNPESS